MGVKKQRECKRKEEKIIALAGNPNVGKSTVFNGLTGLKQHTGNWPGKTVTSAEGHYQNEDTIYRLVDLPGTYSLSARSAEEEVARDFLCFQRPDAVILVVDGTCLERNLNLVLQTLEITGKAVLCVNLMDEAKKKSIHIDLDLLRRELGIPVVGTNARSKEGLQKLMEEVAAVQGKKGRHIPVRYGKEIEDAVAPLVIAIRHLNLPHDSRWLALRLAANDEAVIRGLREKDGCDIFTKEDLMAAMIQARTTLNTNGINEETLTDRMTRALIKKAEEISQRVVQYGKADYSAKDRRLDRIFTSRRTGIPVMLLLLALIFWLTIAGANIPSQLLAMGFGHLEERLLSFALWSGIPPIVYEPLIFGVYRVLSWVIAVMLPPMAIFFPLFTLLEDAGYLPRVAFNLDRQFKKCSACGKQALTMAMGFGCNAAAIIGCRIIDSPRERLIAIITNSFVPCNGRLAPPW